MDSRAIIMWFDCFDWTLTPEEYAAYGVDVPAGTTVVDGFVVLSGREELAWARRRKATWAWRKFKKAKRWARVLALIPFVRLIAIGNALGYGNCHEGSDIDLVIITAPRHVWITRLIISFILKVFRQRPAECGRDALCPSFFLTTEALDLETLQLSERRGGPMSIGPPEGGPRDLSGSLARLGMPFGQLTGADSGPPLRPPLEIRNLKLEIPSDPYLLFWVTQLTVLYDAGGVYDAFWQANEHWVRRWLPEAQPRGAHPRIAECRMQNAEFGRIRIIIERLFCDSIGNVFERWSRRFQEHRLPVAVHSLANRDTRVVVDDRIIKLHTNDRREEFRDRWTAKL